MMRVIPDFMLVDLRSQFEAVRDFTTNWRQNEVLTWLEIFGEITKTEGAFGNTLYGFHSEYGLNAVFWFDEDGQITMAIWG